VCSNDLLAGAKKLGDPMQLWKSSRGHADRQDGKERSKDELIMFENHPLVSILIPAFNAEKWIGETLRSALAQTWPRTEVIVIDDGSSDRTIAIAQRFEAQGVRVISQQNQGAAAARNNAFAHSSGDYIQWLDADDLLAPDKIQKQMEEVRRGIDSRKLLSGPWAHFIYRPRSAAFIPSPLWNDLSPQEWLTRKLERNVYMQTSTWLVSRQLTEAAGPWDTRLLGDDDGEYFCRVLLASHGTHFVPDAKVYYRTACFNGLSYVGRSHRKIVAHWLSMQLHIRYLRSFGDSARTRDACMQYLRDSLTYFYPREQAILREANAVAAELGGSLGAPEMSWEYAWLEKSLGWKAARSVQVSVQRIRCHVTRHIDHALYLIERKKQMAGV
jgi:glycosyltransferase involved in cell wall biosynthesis